jgi:hypothetical protein
MAGPLSAEDIERIENMFRELLGRELTQAERKYLGLSATLISIDDLELESVFEPPKSMVKKAG